MARMLLVAMVLFFGRAQSQAEGIHVSAAISLKAALEKARPQLETAAGAKISFTYGASGTLATQIRQGAPVDVFLSADRPTIATLAEQKMVDAETVQVFARGDLVLVVPRVQREGVSIQSFEDLAKPQVGKIAMGAPKSVPAGAYAKETLTALKLYDGLEKTGKLITGENVAQVLTYVDRGEADAGLVYATDALHSKNVTVVATAPENSHQAIEYVCGSVTESKYAQAAAHFEAALLGEDVQKVFASMGFKRGPSPLPVHK